MIVVSDTTPLISFLKIGHLDLLQKLFGEVQIPEAVFHELTENKKFFHEAEQIKNCFFIQVVEVKEYQFVNLLRRATGLDLGESEAIILSDSIHADLLLMDEVKGREVADNRLAYGSLSKWTYHCQRSGRMYKDFKGIGKAYRRTVFPNVTGKYEGMSCRTGSIQPMEKNQCTA